MAKVDPRQAERILLGQILLDPTVWNKTDLVPDNFVHRENRQIYLGMKQAITDGVTPDIVSLPDYCPEVSPVSIATLPDETPTSANWQYYRDMVVENGRMARLRGLQQRFGDLLVAKDSQGVIAALDEALSQISLQISRRTIQRPKDVMLDFIDKVEERMQSGGKLPGITTGLSLLDDMIGGLQPGRVYYIGGRPGDGKTALGLNMAAAAAKQKTPAGYLSMEMANTDLIERVIVQEGRIPSDRLASGFITPNELGRVVDTCGAVGEWPLFMYDEPHMKLSDVKGVIRRMVRECGVKVVYVDYIGLIDAEDPRLRRIDQIMRISIELTSLAKQLQIPLVVLSQLTRDSRNRVPNMGDFGDSSQIEKDAWAAFLIYHERGDFREILSSKILVGKNRSGPEGFIDVNFAQQYVRFDDAAARERRRDVA